MRYYLGLTLFVFFLIKPFTGHCEQNPDHFSEIINAYAERGGEKYMIDEDIIQRSHVLQAAYIADSVGAPEDLVVGLLLHDVGQIIHSEEQDIEKLHEMHDEYGADWLEKQGFPEAVTKICRYHTLAKVILCEERENYYENLSRASQESYHIQNAKYKENSKQSEVIEAFRNDPRKEDFKAARMCDEMAKIVDFNSFEDDTRNDRGEFFHPPGFEYYRDMVKRVREGNGKAASNPQWIAHINKLLEVMTLNRDEFEEIVRSGPATLLEAAQSSLAHVYSVGVAK